MSQTDRLSGRYPQARSASGQVAILRSTPSVRRSQFGFAPALSITSSLVFSTSDRSISYSRVPDGQRRRKARVSSPAAARTTWRAPNLLQESSRKSSKKRVRITGYSPGPSACAAASMRSSQATPSGPANEAASGSQNRRSARSLSRARAAAIHRDVGAIGLMEGSTVTWPSSYYWPERGASQSRRRGQRLPTAAGPTSMPTCPAFTETYSLSGPLARRAVALVWEGGTVQSHLPE